MHKRTKKEKKTYITSNLKSKPNLIILVVFRRSV